MKTIFDDAKNSIDVLTKFNKTLTNAEFKDLLDSIYSKLNCEVEIKEIKENKEETAESFVKWFFNNITKIEKSSECDTNILYFIDDKKIMVQDTKTDIFYVNDSIWYRLQKQFSLKNNEINELLTRLSRLELNCNIKSSSWLLPCDNPFITPDCYHVKTCTEFPDFSLFDKI